jgi:hypothetical protein
VAKRTRGRSPASTERSDTPRSSVAPAAQACGVERLAQARVAHVQRASDARQHGAEVEGPRPRRLGVEALAVRDGAHGVVRAGAGQHVEQAESAASATPQGDHDLAPDPVAVDQRLLQHEHVQAPAGEDRGQGAARDPGADDHHIRFFRQGALPTRWAALGGRVHPVPQLSLDARWRQLRRNPGDGRGAARQPSAELDGSDEWKPPL